MDGLVPVLEINSPLCSRGFNEHARPYRKALLTFWRNERTGHCSVQLPPLQHLRRVLFTRCAGCGGRSHKGRPACVALEFSASRGRWWQSEPGMYHWACTGEFSR